MDDAADGLAPRRHTFSGVDGNALVAEVFEGAGEGGGAPVLLAHGGGQTRHAWFGTAKRLAALGWTAISYDQRGHGESEWAGNGDYAFGAFADDLSRVAEDVASLYGRKPVAVGASLGGIAGLLAEGESETGVLDALVLVDITPTVEQSGVEKILGFMASHVEKGFGSLEEAAEAIASYLPHRKRPRDLSGLNKNLRIGDDGRYRWHWDPRFLEHRLRLHGEHEMSGDRRIAAAKRLKVPVLLVRGKRSELVTEQHVNEFMELVPHARFADVSEAGHMVAGDRNDAFADALTEFIETLRED